MIGRQGTHRAAIRDELTPRQREVLALVSRGRTNGEIAQELGISFDTAKSHVSEILGKLGVDSREEAAAAWRADQGVLGRWSRRVEGALLFSFAKGATLAAIGIAVAALGVGAVAFIAANRGDSPGDSDATPVPGSEATATPGTPFADFGPTLTPAELAANPGYRPSPSPVPTQMPPLTSIAGKPVRELTVGDAVDLPQGVVLLANLTCYACEGGWNLYRFYRDEAGAMHSDPVRPPIVGQARGDGTPYLHSLAHAGMETYFAAVCRGYCGGIGTPEPGSTLDLWRSLDGGISWVLVSTGLPLDSFLVGVNNGEVLVSTYLGQGSNGKPQREYAWYPEVRKVEPPPGTDNVYPGVSGLRGLTWQEFDQQFVSSDVHYIGPSGSETILRAPAESRIAWRTGVPTWPNTYWSGNQSNYASPQYYGVTDTATGTFQSAYRWPGTTLWIGPTLADGRVIGNAEIDDPRFPVVGIAAFYPVVIDFGTATVHPIRGLPPSPSLGERVNGPYSFPHSVIEAKPLRVVAGAGDCLNVRREPSATAPIEQCFADGVLLFQRGDDPGGEWTPVTGPGGVTGWASSAFLAR